MRVPLTPVEGDGDIARFVGQVTIAAEGWYALDYSTRTGALLRLDGAATAAFDREHEAIRTRLAAGEHTVALEVERRSLPASGLPAGPGLRWQMLLARAAERPRRVLGLEPAVVASRETRSLDDELWVIGHAHLDVAWLWTFAEARRKAVRTFATALNLLDNHATFVFTQSQPQLYAWVQQDEPALFERVQQRARAGRFDASGAAMWVEPDCNIPSGESLLRQLIAGIRYAERELGTAPSVAWLPDSFGFPVTLPSLLRHAGIANFATTKLRWNDTTEFPHARFIWEGPDGKGVLGAVFASYEGAVSAERARLAQLRGEPLVVGYSDGGGGPTDAIVDAGTREGDWTTLGAWFERAREREVELPVVRDELYLEYHRGVFTTHHDIKARNASLERALEQAELALAWMTVLRASPFFIDEARRSLGEAWEIVLRNQFHDVLPGTSIAPVYADARAEYDRADALAERVLQAARSTLPRFAGVAAPKIVVPERQAGGFVFENAALRARVRDDGAVAELGVAGGPNLVHAANVLAAYHDRPAKWEAWNIDLGYEQRSRSVDALGVEAAADGLYVRYRIGASFAAARLSLAEGEPFLRVNLAVDWRERRTLLRCENDLALRRARAFFGAPHGVIERAAEPVTPAERAKFEACGQRYARVDGEASSGIGSVAMLALDTYGWSVAAAREGVKFGHSLLRGTVWPDPQADVGEQHLSYAFLPSAGTTNGAFEAAWQRFTRTDTLPAMFTSDDPAIAIVATKPADDGDGIVVRARECDGAARDAAIICAPRAVSLACVDALERPVEDDGAALSEGRISARFGAYGLRSFRVRFA
jgi:alpha-mannosidase